VIVTTSTTPTTPSTPSTPSTPTTAMTATTYQLISKQKHFYEKGPCASAREGGKIA